MHFLPNVVQTIVPKTFPTHSTYAAERGTGTCSPVTFTAFLCIASVRNGTDRGPGGGAAEKAEGPVLHWGGCFQTCDRVQCWNTRQ